MSKMGKERTDMPWVELPDEVDEDFIQFIKNYNIVSRPTVMELLAEYTDKDIFVFKTAKRPTSFFLDYCDKFQFVYVFPSTDSTKNAMDMFPRTDIAK